MSDIPPLITSPAPAPAAPVTAGERIELLDVLRGFALFGILLVNITSFAWPIYFVSPDYRGGDESLNLAADWLMRFFAEGKFYPLFSMLFGAGIALQIARAKMRGSPFVSFHVRRMLVLLLIGGIHAFLIWEGDILMFYAMMGLVLLAFRDCKPPTLLAWIIVCLLVPTLIYVVLGGVVSVLSWLPGIAEGIESAIAQWYESDFFAGERDLEVFANGTFLEIMAQRAKNVVYLYLSSIAIAPVVLMMFLIGLYAGKRGILNNPGAHLPLFRRMLWCAALVGIPGNVLYLISYELSSESWLWWFGAIILYSVAGPGLMLAYVSSIVLLCERGHWRQRLGILAPVGRMALTNYLLQSLVCTTIFYSYGFGFYGKIEMGTLIAIAMLVFLAQIPLSHWWLRRFRFGPVEWLWRSASYGRFQPMRRLEKIS